MYLSQGQLKLITKGAVYSYGNLYYNFKDSFEKLEVAKRDIQSVLILGLGMGSIIQLLEQKFHLRANYDVVEIDPEVVALFEKYRKEFMDSSCNVHVADAFDYMKVNHKKYDLVCMDIFSDKTVPVIFESEEYLLNLRNALNENGLLIYNRLAIGSNDQLKNESFFKIYNQVFLNASILKLDFNWMFVVESK